MKADCTLLAMQGGIDINDVGFVTGVGGVASSQSLPRDRVELAVHVFQHLSHH